MNSTSPERKGFIGFLTRMYDALDWSRRFAMNMFVLLIIVILVVASSVPGGKSQGLKEKTTLVLNLTGQIVEQHTGGRGLSALTRQLGEEDPETQLRDVVNVIDAAAKDEKIIRILLLTDDLQSGGLASLREIAMAMDRFRAAGKEIVAWGGMYDQRRYFLAAHAQQVYVHPMGMVMLEGFGGYRNYYRNALDKLGISANVVRAGKYKNFGETYLASAPSKETLESDKYLYDGLWEGYLGAVEPARKLAPGSVMKTINKMDELMIAAGGDTAKVAVDAKWADGIKTRDELRQMLIDKGEKDEENKTFRQISFANYLATVKPKQTGDAVAVVVAEGSIVDGNAPAGQVGGRSTAELIRKARNDDRFKSILLRVNSPGGSAVASEFIRRELELAKKQGKPVVISMGDVAASGGYWISMGADEVIADPLTITGSIGVVVMLPTGEKAMDKLSINTGGYATTWLRENGYDPRRPLDARFVKLVQAGVDYIYTDFKTKAAASRKTTPDKIDEVGQGRVWTGKQAKDRGLIDKLGFFADAVKAAKSRGKLDDEAAVVYIQPEKSKIEKILEAFGGAGAKAIAKYVEPSVLNGGIPGQTAKDIRRDLNWLVEMGDAANSAKGGLPIKGIAHCLCADPL
ncbi:MAG: signal peptide peptidase SppA [Betaproteobacteria bacterium]|nr:signal peptide peptidase SppA [Betaproteobacteria bacterium]